MMIFKKIKKLISHLLIRMARASYKADVMDQKIQAYRLELMQRNPDLYSRRREL